MNNFVNKTLAILAVVMPVYADSRFEVSEPPSDPQPDTNTTIIINNEVINTNNNTSTSTISSDTSEPTPDKDSNVVTRGRW